jgi:hypothetical protein
VVSEFTRLRLLVTVGSQHNPSGVIQNTFVPMAPNCVQRQFLVMTPSGFPTKLSHRTSNKSKRRQASKRRLYHDEEKTVNFQSAETPVASDDVPAQDESAAPSVYRISRDLVAVSSNNHDSDLAVAPPLNSRGMACLQSGVLDPFLRLAFSASIKDKAQLHYCQ